MTARQWWRLQQGLVGLAAVPVAVAVPVPVRAASLLAAMLPAALPACCPPLGLAAFLVSW